MSNKKGRGVNGGPVGFGNPPVEGQFKPGRKPPGSGRKKGSKNYSTLIAELMGSTVTVVVNGKSQKMPLKQALLYRAAHRGLNGTVNDVCRLFELVERLAPSQVKDPLIIHYKNIEGDDW